MVVMKNRRCVLRFFVFMLYCYIVLVYENNPSVSYADSSLYTREPFRLHLMMQGEVLSVSETEGIRECGLYRLSVER